VIVGGGPVGMVLAGHPLRRGDATPDSAATKVG